MSKEPEVEYPRWVFPPDGGPGKIVQTPDDKPKGWLETPTEPQPASGERIIGQPVFTGKGEANQDAYESDDDAKKSKKK